MSIPIPFWHRRLSVSSQSGAWLEGAAPVTSASALVRTLHSPSNSDRWSCSVSPRRIFATLPSATQYSAGRICSLIVESSSSRLGLPCHVKTSKFAFALQCLGSGIQRYSHTEGDLTTTHLKVVRGRHGHAVGAGIVHHQAIARRRLRQLTLLAEEVCRLTHWPCSTVVRQA